MGTHQLRPAPGMVAGTVAVLGRIAAVLGRIAAGLGPAVLLDHTAEPQQA